MFYLGIARIVLNQLLSKSLIDNREDAERMQLQGIFMEPCSDA